MSFRIRCRSLVSSSTCELRLDLESCSAALVASSCLSEEEQEKLSEEDETIFAGLEEQARLEYGVDEFSFDEC